VQLMNVGKPAAETRQRKYTGFFIATRSIVAIYRVAASLIGFMFADHEWSGIRFSQIALAFCSAAMSSCRLATGSPMTLVQAVVKGTPFRRHGLLFTDIRDILNYVEAIGMEYQNITLSISKDILKKVKHLAVEKNTSVSGLLSRHLEEIVARDDAYHRAKIDQIEIMAKGYDLIDRGKVSWTRDDLYDRR